MKRKWGSRDKAALLLALRAHGAGSAARLAGCVRRSPREVRARLAVYRRLAARPQHRPPPSPHPPAPPHRPQADAWLAALPPASTRLAAALRLIAAMEASAAPHAPLYRHLAALLDGSHTERLDRAVSHFLLDAVHRLAVRVKETEFSREMEHIHDVTRVFPDVRTPRMTTELPTAAALRTILSSAAANPLEIPDEFLVRTDRPRTR